MKINLFLVALIAMLLTFTHTSYAEDVKCKRTESTVIKGNIASNGERFLSGDNNYGTDNRNNIRIYANIKWAGTLRQCDWNKLMVHMFNVHKNNQTISHEQLAQESLVFLQNNIPTLKATSLNVLVRQNKFKHAGGYCDETKLMTGERLDNGDYFYETFNFSGKMWMGLRWGSDYEMYQCDVQALNAAIQKYVMDNPGVFLEDIESMARTYINDNFHNGQDVGFGLSSN